MKSMIPFLTAKLPVATVAQSQSVVSPGVPSVAIPKTTGVIVIQTAKQGVTPQQVMAVMPAEIRATVNLYLDGKIRQWYSRGDGKGVVFLVEAKTEDEARAIMEALPLAKERLMDDQYVPVGPLMPLRALMGPGAQQDSTSCFAQGLPQAFVHPWEDSNRSWQRIHLRAGPTSQLTNDGSQDIALYIERITRSASHAIILTARNGSRAHPNPDIRAPRTRKE